MEEKTLIVMITFDPVTGEIKDVIVTTKEPEGAVSKMILPNHSPFILDGQRVWTTYEDPRGNYDIAVVEVQS